MAVSRAVFRSRLQGPSRGARNTDGFGFALQPAGRVAGFARFGKPVFQRVWPWPEPDPSKTGLVVRQTRDPLCAAHIEQPDPNTPSLLLTLLRVRLDGMRRIQPRAPAGSTSIRRYAPAGGAEKYALEARLVDALDEGLSQTANSKFLSRLSQPVRSLTLRKADAVTAASEWKVAYEGRETTVRRMRALFKRAVKIPWMLLARRLGKRRSSGRCASPSCSRGARTASACALSTAAGTPLNLLNSRKSQLCLRRLRFRPRRLRSNLL
jgi:hypothetical protein